MEETFEWTSKDSFAVVGVLVTGYVFLRISLALVDEISIRIRKRLTK